MEKYSRVEAAIKGCIPNPAILRAYADYLLHREGGNVTSIHAGDIRTIALQLVRV